MAFTKERMEKTYEREISSVIFQEVKNEKIKFVTITKVSLTNDYSYATVYYTIYGTEEQVNATKDALLDAKGFIKSALSKRLNVRKIPDLIFKYDESFEKGNKIEQILRNLK